MNQDKTPPHIKLDGRNHVEKPLLSYLDRPGWDIIVLMQDLLTGKKRVTALLNDKEVASL
ncbi:MAG: hypothetical protein GQ533_04660 [Methanosarcinaceae archaeon]|jgi:hypothetical protein|nr:hypothetical protein [Methanosarcinaceae archaeon]